MYVVNTYLYSIACRCGAVLVKDEVSLSVQGLPVKTAALGQPTVTTEKLVQAIGG